MLYYRMNVKASMVMNYQWARLLIYLEVNYHVKLSTLLSYLHIQKVVLLNRYVFDITGPN